MARPGGVASGASAGAIARVAAGGTDVSAVVTTCSSTRARYSSKLRNRSAAIFSISATGSIALAALVVVTLAVTGVKPRVVVWGGNRSSTKASLRAAGPRGNAGSLLAVWDELAWRVLVD